MLNTDRQALIDHWIEFHPRKPGPAEARLKVSAIPVWSIVGDVGLAHGDLAELAAAFDVPTDAVEAALAYYEEHRGQLDARIAENLAVTRR